MPKIIKYEYNSSLAPHIATLIEEKRALGFIYNNEAGILRRFDDYWKARGFDDRITQERLMEWCAKTDTEGCKSLSNRVVAISQFCKYLSSFGEDVHIPHLDIRIEKPVVHVLSATEIKELFDAIDSYRPVNRDPAYIRMAESYRVIFRLILCLGTRLNETRMIRIEDVDLEKASVRLLETKGQKQRVLCLNDDLKKLLSDHMSYLNTALCHQPKWLFPGYDPNQPVSKGTVDKRFRISWGLTSFAGKTEKDPTVHSLRWTFIMQRLLQWQKEGTDRNAMLPYLLKHLGHKTLDETYYYFKLIQEKAADAVANDKTARYVIPEVGAR